MRAPRVLISGWYGNGNLGDEALLQCMVEQLRNCDRPLDLTVFSDDPAHTAATVGVRAIRRPRGKGSARAELRAILASEVFVLGGGGLLKDYGQGAGNVAAWVRPLVYASRLRRATMTYAIGVDEIRFEESRKLAAHALERTDWVTFRDEGSATAALDAGARIRPLVSADPALLTRPSDGSRPAPGLVGVCLRNWFSRASEVEDPGGVELFMTRLAGALDALADKHGTNFVFVPFRSHSVDDDADVARRVIERMRHSDRARLAPVPQRGSEAASLLSTCDLIVGQRLHSLILAAAVGTPFFAISYMPKVSHFCDSVGMGAFQTDLQRVVREPDYLEAAIETAYREREGIRRTMQPQVDELKRKGRMTSDLLVALAHKHPARDGIAKRLEIG